MVDFSKFRYNEYLVKSYLAILGENETLKLMKANEEKLPLTIRTNTLKTTHEELKRKLENRGFKLKKHEYGEGFYVEEAPFNITATPEYLFGYFYIQDPNSWIPVLELNPSKENVVLDMCAAPGGKSSHIAQLMKNDGVLVSMDINLERTKEMRTNFQRLGVRNSIIFRKDALKANKIGLESNKILLDAPCSGDGVIRKDYESRKRISKKVVYKFSSIQKQLINIAYEILPNEGELIYSTCSTSPEEDELIIQHAIDIGFKVKPLQTKYGDKAYTEIYGMSIDKSISYARRFWPHKHLTGFFVARLVK